MLNLIKPLIPKFIRVRWNQYSNKRRYDVSFGPGATASNCIFEGKNFVNTNTAISDSYIGIGTYFAGNSNLKKMQIGRFCSVGQNVRNGFGIHPTDWVSTHPAFYSLQKQAGFTFAATQMFEEHKYIDAEKKYYIQIGNDVFVGSDVKIMDGVTIGDGAIIALGSLVANDVPSYSIYGGIPAKLIKMRFDKKTINALCEIKWWHKDGRWLREYASLFKDPNKLINTYTNGVDKY